MSSMSYQCMYCGGAAVLGDDGWRHETAERRIDPANVSPGDFVSLAHNETSRINVVDVIDTRKEGSK